MLDDVDIPKNNASRGNLNAEPKVCYQASNFLDQCNPPYLQLRSISMRRQMLKIAVPTSRRLGSVASRWSSWSPGPAPPRLPKEEQDVFDQLQRQSTGAFSTRRAPLKVNQPPSSASTSHKSSSASSSPDEYTSATSESRTQPSQPSVRANVKEGEELHPNVRRGAPAEFQGDTNPKTGEVGGPKNEPLRWGNGGDWSYNGRVSDF